VVADGSRDFGQSRRECEGRFEYSGEVARESLKSIRRLREAVDWQSKSETAGNKTGDG